LKVLLFDVLFYPYVIYKEEEKTGNQNCHGDIINGHFGLVQTKNKSDGAIRLKRGLDLLGFIAFGDSFKTRTSTIM
tara:strand:- start:1233 stop:1460 length:228 start_codon:yes stop_codon:yes gene_type:complete